MITLLLGLPEFNVKGQLAVPDRQGTLVQLIALGRDIFKNKISILTNIIENILNYRD